MKRLKQNIVVTVIVYAFLTLVSFNFLTPLYAISHSIINSDNNDTINRWAVRDNPYINLLDGVNLTTQYHREGFIQKLKAKSNRPLSLTSGDFDRDGVSDLVCGYTSPGGGILMVRRGNVDSIYPNSPEAHNRMANGIFSDSAFLARVRVFELPAPPEFLSGGDFNADGLLDLVASFCGSNLLYFLPGDGSGGFGKAEEIKLPGTLTTLMAGEINRKDGLTDLAVGIVGPDGPQALVFESCAGALFCKPEVFPLPGKATAFSFAQLDKDYPLDLAVATGNELLIIHGRDKKLYLDKKRRAAAPSATVTKLSFPFLITSLAAGDFTGGCEMELALLSEGSTLHLIDPMTKSEIAKIKIIDSKLSNPRAHLVRAQVSSLPKDDLVVVDGANHKLHIIMMKGKMEKKRGKPVPSSLMAVHKENLASRQKSVSADIPLSANWLLSSDIKPVTLNIKDEPVAALPMRLNMDALNDLVILNNNRISPTVILTDAFANFVVNNTGDESDGDVEDGICDTGSNAVDGFTGICTLRAAIQQANHDPGLDSITFSIGAGSVISPGYDLWAGYPVTIDGTSGGSPGIELNESGGSLYIDGGNSTVRGLVINNSCWHGIQITDGGNNIIEGNYIGTDFTGSFAMGCDECGVGVFSNNNTIGGTTDNSRNVMSGNAVAGCGMAGDYNSVLGNYLGTDVSGLNALGNTVGVLISVRMDGASVGDNNVVGNTSGQNIISGNQEGMQISYEASGNLVQNNNIGIDATGSKSLGNSSVGIVVIGDDYDTIGNTIGGGAGLRNIISGNDNCGVVIYGFDARQNVLNGNFIGTNSSDTDLGNSSAGVFINNAPDNQINDSVIAYNGAGIGVTIVGEDMATDGLSMDNMYDNENFYPVSISNVDIHDNFGLGLRTLGTKLDISDAAINNNLGGIINIGELSAHNITIEDNDHTGLVSIGGSIYLADSSINSNKSGILCFSTTDITIENTDVLENKRCGIIAIAADKAGTKEKLSKPDIGLKPVNIRYCEVKDNGGIGILSMGDITLHENKVDSNDGPGVIALGSSIGLVGAHFNFNKLGILAISKTNVSILGADVIGNKSLGILAFGGTRVDINISDVNGNFKGGILSAGKVVSAKNIGVMENDGPGIISIADSISLKNAMVKLNKIGVLDIYKTDITIQEEDGGDLEICENEGFGIIAFGGREATTDISDIKVNENGNNGILWFGNFLANNVEVNKNQGNGIMIIKSSAEIDSGQVCLNEKHGIIAAKTVLDLRQAEVCENNGGGIKFKGRVSFKTEPRSSMITDNIIAGNVGDGIFYKRGADLVLNNNNILNNDKFGVNNSNKRVVINAENNWWGDADGPKGSNGDGVKGRVDFKPWLTEPID